MDDVELIVSANGCTDNTNYYMTYLHSVGLNFKEVWHDEPLGFPKAVNAGLKYATGDKIVLLNNDTVLLDQPKNNWLDRLNIGSISAVLTQYSEITKRNFAVFFCVMIDRKVFDTIGYLDEDFYIGGCEDIDFCFRADNAGFMIIDVGHNGDFPVYHAAEGTMHDPNLVSDWDNVFLKNQLRLDKKHNG